MIYTITTLEDAYPNTGRRTVGYFTTQDQAMKAIYDGAHLHEALYDLALIEEVSPGIYPHANIVAWYKWNHKTRQWDWLSGAPIELVGVCNFSIG